MLFNILINFMLVFKKCKKSSILSYKKLGIELLKIYFKSNNKSPISVTVPAPNVRTISLGFIFSFR